MANYESAEMRRVWAIPSEGGEPRKLDLAMQRLRLTDVSADGRRLAFAGNENKAGNRCVQQRARRGGQPEVAMADGPASLLLRCIR